MKMGDTQEWIKVSGTMQEGKRSYLPRLPLYHLFEEPAHQLILVDFLKQLLQP